MDTTTLTAFIRETYNVEPEYLWADYPEAFVFRHAENRKWFGVVMETERARLGLAGSGKVRLLDVKTGPLLGGLLSGSARHRPGLAHEQDPLAGRPAGRLRPGADRPGAGGPELFPDGMTRKGSVLCQLINLCFLFLSTPSSCFSSFSAPSPFSASAARAT